MCGFLSEREWTYLEVVTTTKGMANRVASAFSWTTWYGNFYLPTTASGKCGLITMFDYNAE